MTATMDSNSPLYTGFVTTRWRHRVTGVLLRALPLIMCAGQSVATPHESSASQPQVVTQAQAAILKNLPAPAGSALATSVLSEPLTQQLADIQPLQSQTGVLVIDPSTDQVLYSHQAQSLLIPASTQKLLTAVAAIAELGPEFRYATELWSDAPIRQGHLAGSLYLRFSGDPSLTQADLKALFGQLGEQGITQIDGHIYLVGEQQEQVHAPGWVWDDLGICYAAPVSSFIIDQNCVYGQLQPSANGKASQVNLASSSVGIKISSDVQFTPNADAEFCQLALIRQGANRYHLQGCHPQHQAVPLAIAVTEPQQFAQDAVRAIVNNNHNLTLAGKVKVAYSLPSNAKLIQSHQSAPLPELLDIMLLKSDNLIADSLFKQVGKHYYQTQSSFTHGSAAMRRILTALGIDLTSANIVDGSGLSRYNLLNAKQLADVLRLIHQDARFQGLIASLPQAGKTGTLKYRRGYTTAPLKERIFAKTGSMQGVANLAGFIRLPDQQDILFVVLENGISPELNKLRKPAFSADFLSELVKMIRKDAPNSMSHKLTSP